MKFGTRLKGYQIILNFHSMSVYDERYIRAKVREVNGVSITNFLVDKYQKKTCITLA